MSSNNSNPQLLYFDFIALKDITNPDQGQVLLTFKGNVFRLPNGTLAFGIPIFARIRNIDGTDISSAEQINWMAYGLQWAPYYLASFLEILQQDPSAYSDSILPAPKGFHPVITKTDVTPGQYQPVISVAPRSVWTQGSGYNAKTYNRDKATN
jgi:hypothetical protein